MKKIIILFATMLSLSLASCGNNKTQSDETVAEDSVLVNANEALSVENVLTQADSLVNQEVTLKGVITHICKHSGRHCFMIGEQDSTVSMRIEAKGNIGGFNRELNGAEVAVKGILHASRLSQEYIDEMETELEKSKAAGSESCDADLQNIKHMREWMKANNKDTFSIYFLEGQEYEVVE